MASLKTVVDMIGNEVTFQFPPQRIVSLVPSQTELLAEFRLDREVVGITRFCIHPESWHATKTVVGGTKDFDLHAIDALSPDLIIANKEENERDGIDALRQKYPVWISDIKSIDDALQMIREVGEIADRSSEGLDIADKVSHSLSNVVKRQHRRALYLIWRKPWMAAGADTFISNLLHHMGLENSCPAGSRYPVLNADDLKRLQPEVVILSSEPFPFSSKHIAEISLLCPGASVILVDGEMFSWYGSRLLKSADYLNKLSIP